MKRAELTQEILKEYLNYNPSTGIFNAKHSARFGSLPAGRKLGRLHNTGYTSMSINGVIFLAHRLAFLYVYGAMPKKPLQIDHINRIPTDNAIDNLRIVTPSENARNSGMRRNNTSGHKGVCFDKHAKKWEANIGIKGGLKVLGYHETKEQAIAARKKAEIDLNYYEVKERKVV